MKCKICGSEHVRVIYNDPIRMGGVGRYTKKAVPMLQCADCNVIWHEPISEDIEKYYESNEYRDSLDEGSEEIFYALHDKETLDKLQYTTTDIFRNKTLADVGCGAGSFLDMVKGATSRTVAIEPSEMFRKALQRKGFATYPYAKDALDHGEKADVVTSFDVIEHVEQPLDFLRDIYALLRDGGQAIVGTPTDAPVYRQLLGECYEKKVLFSVQHLWIFSAESLKLLADKVGFKNIKLRVFQRHGIDNLIGWCLTKSPNQAGNVPIFAGGGIVDSVWRSTCSELQLGDYIVLYADK